MPAPRGPRPTLRWLHRWLGLTLGLLFAIVGLSGSLLIFQPQFFDWAHGDMLPDRLAAEPGSVDAWLANARKAAPGLGEPIIVWRPLVSHNVSRAGMLIFGGRKPGGLGNMGLLAVLVAPATGEVLGTVDVDRSPAYAPLFLHRDLWAGEAGRVVSGIMAAGSLVGLLIGLWLWWPGRARAMRKLSPRPWRRTFTAATPIHDWTGIWTFVALLVLTASGLCLVRPGWVEPVLAVLPDAPPEPARDPANCGGAIGLDAALAQARHLAPGADWTALYPQEGRPGVWNIRMKSDGDLDAAHGDARVVADLACGTVALRETAAARPPRHTAEVLIDGLHDGSVLGRIGEIVVAVLGLVPMLLFVTGLIAWTKGRTRRRLIESRPVP